MFPSCGAAITWKYISIRFELVCLIRFFLFILVKISHLATVALFPWLAVSGGNGEETSAEKGGV